MPAYPVLSDNFKNPKIMFLDCFLWCDRVRAVMFFVSFGIAKREYDLFTEKGEYVCTLPLPAPFSYRRQDMVGTLLQEIPILFDIDKANTNHERK